MPSNRCRYALTLHWLLVTAVLISHQTASAFTNDFKLTSHSQVLDDFPRMDGCRYIFLDIGSNIGIHARFLYESAKYPQQNYSTRLFDKYFPIVDRFRRQDICMVGFEPNPLHRKRLLALQKYFQQNGLRAHWFFAGASKINGNKYFIHTHSGKEKRSNEWGFKTVSEEDYLLHRYNESSRHSVEILPTIRIAEFLQFKVLHRKIPGPLEPSDPPPAVVAKIDIEGEEFAVFEDILGDTLHQHLLCTLAAITIEFHPLLSKAGVKLDTSFKSKAEVLDLIVRNNERQPDCNTQVLEFDTEAYLHDTKEGVAKLKRREGKVKKGSAGLGV